MKDDTTKTMGLGFLKRLEAMGFLKGNNSFCETCKMRHKIRLLSQITKMVLGTLLFIFIIKIIRPFVRGYLSSSLVTDGQDTELVELLSKGNLEQVVYGFGWMLTSVFGVLLALALVLALVVRGVNLLKGVAVLLLVRGTLIGVTLMVLNDFFARLLLVVLGVEY